MVAQFINDHESKPRVLSTLADKLDVTNQHRSQDVMAHTTVPSTCPSATAQLPQMVTPEHSQVHRGCILSRSSTGRVSKIILLMVGRFYHRPPFWHVQKYCCSSMAAVCCSLRTKIATSTSSVQIYVISCVLYNDFYLQHKKWTWYCVHSNIGSKWPKFKMCVRKLEFN